MWLVFLALLGLPPETPRVDVRFCVFDPSGEALRSAVKLWMVRDEGERGHGGHPVRLETSHDGCVDARVAEEVYRARVEGPQHYSRDFRFDPRVSKSIDVEIEPFEARPQAVLVVNEATGEPVDSARVLMEFGGDESGPGSPKGRTDIHGLVIFEALADGPYWLQIAGQPRIEFRTVDVVLGADRQVIEVPVRINPRVLVVGRVVDATGAPVEGARIRAAKYRSKTWSLEDGSFEVYAYATSTSSVTVAKPGFAVATAPIRPEGVDWDVLDVGELVLEKSPP